jgi:hypothetical protein
MAVKDTLVFLEKIGLTDVILPFLLVFTVVYGVLQRSKVLGKQRKIDAIVALVIGLFVVYMVNTMHIVNLFAQYFALVLVAGVLLSIVIMFLGAKGKYLNFIVGIFGIAIALVLLFALSDLGFIDLSFLQSFILPVLAVIAFIAFIWYITKTSTKTREPAPSAERPPQPAPEAPAEAPKIKKGKRKGKFSEIKPGERIRIS